MIELQLGTSAVGGTTPYLIHHIERISGLVEIIKSFYDNFTCCVGDGDILFEGRTGVRQECVMSTFLFNLVVDWITHRTTEDQVRGIRWTPFSYLEDLD